MQKRSSASITLIACGIVSGNSPPWSTVLKRRPVPPMWGLGAAFRVSGRRTCGSVSRPIAPQLAATPMRVLAIEINSRTTFRFNTRMTPILATSHRAFCCPGFLLTPRTPSALDGRGRLIGRPGAGRSANAPNSIISVANLAQPVRDFFLTSYLCSLPDRHAWKTRDSLRAIVNF
jgi:hypothetical protein